MVRIGAKDLQEVTYQLCHIYPRGDKTVSYPFPAYLADHCAERGKLYLEVQYGDSAELASSRPSGEDPDPHQQELVEKRVAWFNRVTDSADSAGVTLNKPASQPEPSAASFPPWKSPVSVAASASGPIAVPPKARPPFPGGADSGGPAPAVLASSSSSLRARTPPPAPAGLAAQERQQPQLQPRPPHFARQLPGVSAPPLQGRPGTAQAVDASLDRSDSSSSRGAAGSSGNGIGRSNSASRTGGNGRGTMDRRLLLIMPMDRKLTSIV